MKKVFREGFTLVELALSMAFIGILSVAVILVIANTVASYRRGLTVAQVNTTGVDIVDDMRLAVSNSSSKAASSDCDRFYDAGTARNDCKNDEAYSFVTAVKKAEVKVSGASIGTDVPVYGAFCTGTYSYIWNSGYFDMMESEGGNAEVLGAGKWATFTYKNIDNKIVEVVGSLNKNNDFTKVGEDGKIHVGDENRPFRLLKIRDDNRAVCVGVARWSSSEGYLGNNYNSYIINFDINGKFDISDYGALDEDPEDLILADTDNDLALFDLYIARPAESTTQKNMFYAASFILGTLGGGVNITTPGRSCEAPSSYTVENFDYCAINKFSFAMQASGNGGIL